jgi:polysaccharide biosynthesis protein PslH
MEPETRIFLIAEEFPYPPYHGGRIDIWNRIKAFKKMGVKVFLLAWYGLNKKESPSENDISIVRDSVEYLILLPIRRDFRRILSLVRYPSLVGARIVGRAKYREILSQVVDFSPSLIFLDGIYCGLTGLMFEKDLKLPVSIRLHNVEHKYMHGQSLLENRARNKVSIFLALLHLKSYEEKIISRVDAFFNISLVDLEYYTNKGYKYGHWLPPFLIDKENAFAISQENNKTQFNVGYFGNLYAPNNIAGISWFVTSVLPIIERQIPNFTVLLVGSNPSPEFLSFIEGYRNITVIQNPKSIDEFISSVDIIINPVQFGSGVNIKSIESLFSDRQVVTTPTGISGLPHNVFETFFMADTSFEFADTIVKILAGSLHKNTLSRKNTRALFDGSILKEMLPIMLLKRSKSGQ